MISVLRTVMNMYWRLIAITILITIIQLSGGTNVTNEQEWASEVIGCGGWQSIADQFNSVNLEYAVSITCRVNDACTGLDFTYTSQYQVEEGDWLYTRKCFGFAFDACRPLTGIRAAYYSVDTSQPITYTLHYENSAFTIYLGEAVDILTNSLNDVSLLVESQITSPLNYNISMNYTIFRRGSAVHTHAFYTVNILHQEKVNLPECDTITAVPFDGHTGLTCQVPGAPADELNVPEDHLDALFSLNNTREETDDMNDNPDHDTVSTTSQQELLSTTERPVKSTPEVMSTSFQQHFTGHYCYGQVFKPECQSGFVILITSAVYGRINNSDCIEEGDSESLGCHADVTMLLHTHCTGHQTCEMFIPHEDFDVVNQCPVELRSYLSVNYTCMQNPEPTLPDLLMPPAFLSDDKKETTVHCSGETFNPTCKDREFLYIYSGMYGLMELNRCYTSDYGYTGCYSNVTQLLQLRCSGKQTCTLFLPHEDFDIFNTCEGTAEPYLEVIYACIPSDYSTSSSTMSTSPTPSPTTPPTPTSCMQITCWPCPPGFDRIHSATGPDGCPTCACTNPQSTTPGTSSTRSTSLDTTQSTQCGQVTCLPCLRGSTRDFSAKAPNECPICACVMDIPKTSLTPLIPTGCNSSFLSCNGMCVPLMWKCDGFNDCGDNMDERNCAQQTPIPHLQSYDPMSDIGYERACQHSNMELECPVGKYLDIVSSIFGRRTNHAQDPICQKKDVTDTNSCSIDTTSFIKQFCNQKDVCQIAVDMVPFEPCPHVNKYLDVIYKCKLKEGETNTPHCSLSQFKCDLNKCMPLAWKCDGKKDCSDRTDEDSCYVVQSSTNIPNIVESSTNTQSLIFTKSLITRRVTSRFTKKATDPPQFIPSTMPKSNLKPTTQPPVLNTPPIVKWWITTRKPINPCSKESFFCKHSTVDWKYLCISKKLVCDRKADCPKNEDESDCSYGDNEVRTSAVVSGVSEGSGVLLVVGIVSAVVIIIVLIIAITIGTVLYRKYNNNNSRPNLETSHGPSISGVPPESKSTTTNSTDINLYQYIYSPPGGEKGTETPDSTLPPHYKSVSLEPAPSYETTKA